MAAAAEDAGIATVQVTPPQRSRLVLEAQQAVTTAGLVVTTVTIAAQGAVTSRRATKTKPPEKTRWEVPHTLSHDTQNTIA